MTGYKKLLPAIGVIGFVMLIIWTTPVAVAEGTVKIYDRVGSLLFEYAGNTGRKQTVPFDRFPDHLVKAVIAGEDESFYTHIGIDPKAIVRSMVLNVRSGMIVSGASTITQQVARLGTGPSSGNLIIRIVHKIREGIMAVRVPLSHTKPEILTMYLNGVYLGHHHYGFQ